jgi:beta-glucanase (GH16 family)
MENLGHAPWYIYNSFHYFTNVREGYSGNAHFIKPQPEGQIYTGTDYSDGYHVYAVEWSPGYVAWFIDGVKVSELWNSNVDYEDLYLILNLAIGGNWTNFPASSGGLGRSSDQRFPTQNDINNFQNPALEIDYVRVYKRK